MRKTRYSEVAELLEKRIHNKTYLPKTLLPTEAELCQEFAISRFTARNALKVLQDKGLIERQQGKGSLVLDETPAVFNSTWSTLDELIEHANKVSVEYQSLTTRYVDEDFAAKTGFLLGSKLSEVHGVRYINRDGALVPLCLICIWIDAKYGVTIDTLNQLGGTVISWLGAEQGVEVESIQQQISAINLSEAEASQLNTDPMIAGLKIRRAFVNNKNETVEASNTIFPAHLFEYRMTLKAET